MNEFVRRNVKYYRLPQQPAHVKRLGLIIIAVPVVPMTMVAPVPVPVPVRIRYTRSSLRSCKCFKGLTPSTP